MCSADCDMGGTKTHLQQDYGTSAVFIWCHITKVLVDRQVGFTWDKCCLVSLSIVINVWYRDYAKFGIFYEDANEVLYSNELTLAIYLLTSACYLFDFHIATLYNGLIVSLAR